MRIAITRLVLAWVALLNQGQAQRIGRQETQGERAQQPLKEQLNEIIDTRENSRGFIAKIPDLFFDTGKATLTTVAQERLAKAAEILAGHPGIRIEVNGYTDTSGTPRYNQGLSIRRAKAVQAELVADGVPQNAIILAQQGVPAAAISAHGIGGANPVASNETAAGRQQNRRVELVVSGDLTGTQATPGR